MILLRKISIYFFSLVTLLVFYLLLIKSEAFFYLIAVLLATAFLATKISIGKKNSFKNFLAFFWLISWFEIAVVSFLALLESVQLKYIFIFLMAILISFYWQLLYKYNFSTAEYKPFSLAVFYNYLSFLAYYFLAAAIFAFAVSLNFSPWLLAFILALFSLINLAYLFWLGQIKIKEQSRYLFIIALIVFEISLLCLWLPFSYFVKVFFVALINYFITFFSLKNLNQEWQTKTFVWHLIILLGIIIIIFATARWF